MFAFSVESDQTLGNWDHLLTFRTTKQQKNHMLHSQYPATLDSGQKHSEWIFLEDKSFALPIQTIVISCLYKLTIFHLDTQALVIPIVSPAFSPHSILRTFCIKTEACDGMLYGCAREPEIFLQTLPHKILLVLLSANHKGLDSVTQEVSSSLCSYEVIWWVNGLREVKKMVKL